MVLRSSGMMHEMGHVLGYEHSASLDLMYPTLSLGQRRLPAGSQGASLFVESAAVDRVFASSDDSGRNWI
jgi:hypothetical protein